MTKYHIQGGKPLRGSITISGAKNAAVAIIPAALLVDGVCRIENIPQISDVTLILQILQELGADIRTVNRTTVDIDCSHIRNRQVPYELARKIRASYYLVGALLGRFGWAEVPLPGGCDLGGRPIDQHVKGFVSMGADVDVRSGLICAKVPGGRLAGGQVYLDMVSVGATMNIMLAAVLADGMTIIENAAKEPHIVDLANFLELHGGQHHGGGHRRHQDPGREAAPGRGLLHHPRPDRSRYLYGRRGRRRRGCAHSERHPQAPGLHHRQAGGDGGGGGGAGRRRPGPPRRPDQPHQSEDHAHPGFPTDMQPQIAAVLCLANGTSVLTEGVWDSRYRYVDEFRRMGAHIQVDGKVAVIEGVPALTGAPVHACDLRAGAAMVIAGLAAQGVTEVDGIYHIERGYENLVGKLAGVGADIRTITVPDEDAKSQAG